MPANGTAAERNRKPELRTRVNAVECPSAPAAQDRRRAGRRGGGSKRHSANRGGDEKLPHCPSFLSPASATYPQTALSNPIPAEHPGYRIPESVRGKRISLESFKVAFGVEMSPLDAAPAVLCPQSPALKQPVRAITRRGNQNPA